MNTTTFATRAFEVIDEYGHVWGRIAASTGDEAVRYVRDDFTHNGDAYLGTLPQALHAVEMQP